MRLSLKPKASLSPLNSRLRQGFWIRNDNCLTLIKATQERRYAGRTIAVDLHNPDFGQFARAFGVRYWLCEGERDFEPCFRSALDCEVALVIVLAGVW